jgi:hypothetical protein
MQEMVTPSKCSGSPGSYDKTLAAKYNSCSNNAYEQGMLGVE